MARSSVAEHYLDTVGVAGSTPVEPTIYLKEKGFDPFKGRSLFLLYRSID